MLSEPRLPPSPGMAPPSFVCFGFALRSHSGAWGLDLLQSDSLPVSLFPVGNSFLLSAEMHSNEMGSHAHP